MTKLWDRAVAITGDGRLGMHVAMAAPINAFDVHAYAMLSSPKLRDAYHRACRYQSLINEATELTFSEGPKEGVLRHGLPGGGSVSRQPAEFLVTTWLRFGRLVTGSQWAPTQVFFAHDRPTDAREHAAVFGAPLQFTSGQTAMHVPVAVLELANPRADATLVGLLDRYTSALLQRQPPLTTVSARVRAWLVEAHGAGVPAARQAAKALAMSERTLHRRLEQERTTFRKLLDQFRHEKAVALLASRRYSIAEVAFLLGYSELSAFYRAFRRWTGKSPAELRDETPKVSPAASH
jgi:AraC-like DNA-binding protein